MSNSIYYAHSCPCCIGHTSFCLRLKIVYPIHNTATHIVNSTRSVSQSRPQSLWRCSLFMKYIDVYYCIYIYTIRFMCAFSLVLDRDLLEDTHTDDVKSTSDLISGLVFLFLCPPNPSIKHFNFYCIKQLDYIFPCVCTVIDHTRRHSV